MTFDIPSDEIGFDTDGAIAFEAIDASSDFAASQDSPGLSIEGSGGWEVGEYITIPRTAGRSAASST